VELPNRNSHIQILFSLLEKQITLRQLATSAFHNQYIYSYKIVSHPAVTEKEEFLALAMKSNFQTNC